MLVRCGKDTSVGSLQTELFSLQLLEVVSLCHFITTIALIGCFKCVGGFSTASHTIFSITQLTITFYCVSVPSQLFERVVIFWGDHPVPYMYYYKNEWACTVSSFFWVGGGGGGATSVVCAYINR